MIGLACKQGSSTWDILRMSVWVSASDVPAVLHSNPFTSRRALWNWKVGRKARPAVFSPAIDHGHVGEAEAIAAIVAQFPQHSFHQPGTVIGVDPGLRLSCSPDLVEVDERGELVAGWEIKTPWTRPIPRNPESVYLEHTLQALANSLVFHGRGNWLGWNLYYHDRGEPGYNPGRHFWVTADPGAGELMADEVERFNRAVQYVDCEDGGETKRKTRKIQEILEGIQVTQLLPDGPV